MEWNTFTIHLGGFFNSTWYKFYYRTTPDRKRLTIGYTYGLIRCLGFDMKSEKCQREIAERLKHWKEFSNESKIEAHGWNFENEKFRVLKTLDDACSLLETP